MRWGYTYTFELPQGNSTIWFGSCLRGNSVENPWKLKSGDPDPGLVSALCSWPEKSHPATSQHGPRVQCAWTNVPLHSPTETGVRMNADQDQSFSSAASKTQRPNAKIINKATPWREAAIFSFFLSFFLLFLWNHFCDVPPLSHLEFNSWTFASWRPDGFCDFFFFFLEWVFTWTDDLSNLGASPELPKTLSSQGHF